MSVTTSKDSNAVLARSSSFGATLWFKKSASRFDLLLFFSTSYSFSSPKAQMSLSKGAIKVLYDEEKANPLHSNPTVQIINIKAVTVQGGIRHRYSISLRSNLVNFIQVLLSLSCM